jgi:prepilin-type N-terminal cleavage/methylation domain-containing protein
MRVESLESRVEGQKREIALRSHCDPRPPRSGMTLIELLVVIIILTTIVAAAIPIMAPANDDRRIREASRSLNTFITSAQARAVATNRLAGIGLKRLSQDTQRPEDRGVCVQVFYVEQQPPYSGFDPNSRARLAFYPIDQTYEVLIQFLTRGTEIDQSQDGLPGGWDADLFPTGMMRPGDVIEINGTQYRLTNEDPNNNAPAQFDANGFFTDKTGKGGANNCAQIKAVPVNGTGQMLNMTHDDDGFELVNRQFQLGTTNEPNPPYFTYPAPYKIHRQAVTTSDEPFQMPEGTAIDLRASGLGDLTYFYWQTIHDNDQPVVVMFNPEGKVAKLRFNKDFQPRANVIDNPPNVFEQPVVEDLYLLVGRRGAIPAPALNVDASLDATRLAPATTDEQRARIREPINWLTPTSQWVVIGSQSGRITTIPIGLVDPWALSTTFGTRTKEELRVEQIVSAREFVRGTTRETGR